MEALEALEFFLSKVLLRKKERYISFAEKPKNKGKFLKAIYHELEDEMDQKYKVEHLPEIALNEPGYKFSPPDNFGELIPNLKDMVSTMEDSFLVVSLDGKYGIHSPESYIDSRSFYVL